MTDNQKRINYGSVVGQGSFWIRVRQIAQIIVTSYIICFVIIVIIAFFTFDEGVKNFLLSSFYMFDFGESFLRAQESLSASFSHTEIVNPYPDIIERHKDYISIMLSVFTIGSLGIAYFMYDYFKGKGDILNKGNKIRGTETGLTTEIGLKNLIEKRVKDKTNNIERSQYDINLTKTIKLPYRDWFLHFLVTGLARSGKSNFIKMNLSQARKLGMKGVLVDVNGDYLTSFYRPGDIILSLFDLRSEAWDFWHENVSPRFLSDAVLAPEEKGGDDFFETAGGKLLAVLILISKSHEEFWTYICLETSDLIKMLRDRNEPIVKSFLGKSATEQAIGVHASSLKEVDFVKYLNHHAVEKAKQSQTEIKYFSFCDWVKNKDDSFVFIVATENEWKECKPLIRAQVETCVTAVFARGENDSNTPIVMVMDEMHKIGKLNVIEDVLSLGSKNFLTLFAGFQNFAQLEAVYGRPRALSLMAGLQNLIAFKCNDYELAQNLSDRIGKVEVETTESNLSSNKQDNANVSMRVREKSNVTSNEIMSLDMNEAWVKLSYYPALKIKFPYVNYPQALDEFHQPVPKTNSVRVKKAWLESIQLIPFYFGEYELSELVDNYFNYRKYLENEKFEVAKNLLKEIAFKVREKSASINGVDYYFLADEHDICVQRDQEHSVFSRYKQKAEKKKDKEESKKEGGEVEKTETPVVSDVPTIAVNPKKPEVHDSDFA